MNFLTIPLLSAMAVLSKAQTLWVVEQCNLQNAAPRCRENCNRYFTSVQKGTPDNNHWQRFQQCEAVKDTCLDCRNWGNPGCDHIDAYAQCQPHSFGQTCWGACSAHASHVEADRCFINSYTDLATARDAFEQCVCETALSPGPGFE